MKLTKYLFVALAVLVLMPLVAAHEAADEKPKTSPDKLFYGISVAIDKLSLALTSDRHAKASKGLAIAHERLLEVEAMREAGKLDKAQKSADNYAQTMDVVATAIEQTPEGETPEKSAEELGETEAELSEVEDAAGDVSNSLNADLTVDSDLTEKQKARIEKINEKIAKHQKAIAQLEERKSKLGQKLFGDKLKEVQEEHAKLEFRELKAQQAIADAQETIARAFDVAPSVPRGQELLMNANSHLAAANAALAGKKYGEAYGQANAAFHIAKAMIKKAEQIKKREQTKEEHKEKVEEKKEQKAERKEKLEEKAAETAEGKTAPTGDEEGNPAQKARGTGEKKTTDSKSESSGRSGGY